MEIAGRKLGPWSTSSTERRDGASCSEWISANKVNRKNEWEANLYLVEEHREKDLPDHDQRELDEREVALVGDQIAESNARHRSEHKAESVQKAPRVFRAIDLHQLKEASGRSGQKKRQTIMTTEIRNVYATATTKRTKNINR